MNLLNIFKKKTNKDVKSTFQKVEKNQLSKVIGGVETVTTGPTLHTAAHEAAHVIQQ